MEDFAFFGALKQSGMATDRGEKTPAHGRKRFSTFTRWRDDE